MKKVYLLLTFFSFYLASHAQISGPTPVNAGEPYTYSYTDNMVTIPEWQIVSGSGTINSTWASGSTYYASVSWTATGTGTLRFSDNGGILDQKNITINVGMPSPVNGSRCGSGTVQLSATPGVGGNQIKWYSTATKGGFITQSLSYTTPNLSATTTYYITTFNTTTLSESFPRVAITATINPIVGSPSLTGATRCGAGVLTLTGTVGTNGNTLRWYASASAPTPLHTGTSYSPNISTTTTYHVSSLNNTTQCESARMPVTATVNPIPGQATTAVFNQCGSGSVNLTTTPGANGNSLKWYSTLTGGTALYTGLTYSTSVSTSTTFYVSSYNSTTGCESTSARQLVQVNVNTPPVAPGVSGYFARFGKGNITLQASGATQYQWYDNAMNLLPGETSNNLTRYYTTTTSYKVKAVDQYGCQSSAVTATGNVFPIPTITYPGGTTFLETTTTSIQLSAQTGYHTYQWKRDGQILSGATSSTYTATTSGFYSVVVSLPNGKTRESQGVRLSWLSNTPESFTPTYDNNQPSSGISGERKNYVRTYTARQSGLSESAFLMANFNKDNVNVATEYLDGLGMPVQSVMKANSPTIQDIIQHKEYDQYGREVKEYLPHASTTTTDADGYRYNAKLEQYNFYRNGTDGIAITGVPYADKEIEPSPLNRVLKQTTPGEAWKMNSGRESEMHTWPYYGDVDGVIIRWTVNASGELVQSGTYNDGKLNVSMVRDENKNEAREYKDMLGRTIVKRVKGDGNDWLLTYYVYDQLNNLRFVLPPELVKRLPSQFLWSTHQSSHITPWAFEYKYDKRKRMIEKKVPGSGWVYMIYDKLDRLVLTQDAEQRGDNLWSFIKYDKLGRPVLTGVYYDDEVYATLRSQIETNNNLFETKGGTLGYLLTTSLPQVNESEVFTVTIYDDYQLPSTFSTGFNFVSELGNTSYTSRTIGMVTATMTRNLETSAWLLSKTYYDNRGRPIQVIAKNHKGWFDRATTAYVNITEKPFMVLTTHHVGTNQIEILRTFEYDHADRLLLIKHKIDNEDEVILLSNEYNAIGQLVKKNVHSTNGGDSYLQNIDYAYNIRGMLTHINNAELTGDFTDQFGMELLYEQGFAQKQHNGNIAGVKWQNAHEGKERSFGYVYDNLGRLKLADHAMKNTSSNWSDELDRYNERINAYDFNGNILGLSRWGLSNPQTQTFGKIDELTYTYKGNNNSNRLAKVADTSGTEGFKDGVNTGDDYGYDENGNMTSDANKDIATIEYNHLNLPKRVVKTNGDEIKYFYDATGMKLRQEVRVSSTLVKATDYLGEFIYENDTLRFVNNEEGRYLTADGAITDGNYQYHIKDYLGNVRMTIDGGSEQFLATMESATRTQEEADFLNLENASFINTTAHNHTPGGTYSIRLSGNTTEVIGPAKSFEVQAGDHFELEVYAKYQETGSGSSGLSTLFASLASAFSLSPTGGAGLEGQAAYNAFNGLFGSGAYIGSTEPYEDEDAPKAFLNYILFDENFALVDFGFDQIADGATTTHDMLSLKLKIEQAGYLYIYLSNENPTPRDVYFDDFKIKRTHIDVKQSTDYYAFGLEISGTAYNKPSAFLNQYLYNGKEKQEELDLNWMDYGARMYVTELGRWGVIDPLSEKYFGDTPYSYTFNNPILFNDPTGMEGNVYGMPMSQVKQTGSVSTVFSATPIFQYATFEGKRYTSEAALSNAIFESVMQDVKRGIIAAPPGNSPILDINGNLLGFDNNVSGNGQVYVLRDKSKFKIGMEHDDVLNMVKNNEAFEFHDRLVIDKIMTAEAFSNGLVNLMDGMEMPDGSKFDRNRLHNGKFSLALSDGTTTNDGAHLGDAAHFRRLNGYYLITLQRMNAEYTLYNLRSLLGIHEYFAHGVKKLIHSADQSEIDNIIDSYPGTTERYIRNVLNRK